MNDTLKTILIELAGNINIVGQYNSINNARNFVRRATKALVIFKIENTHIVVTLKDIAALEDLGYQIVR